MASLNRIFLAGNLTKDAELRYTPAGTAVSAFGIAVNTRMGKNEDGTPKQETLFIDVVLFGKIAESTAEYLKKGKPILIEGRLRYRSWEDNNGNKRSKHEVIASSIQFLSHKNHSDNPDIQEEEDLYG